MSHLRVAPKDHEGYKGSPDHFMLRAYTCDTCVLKSKSNQGCTHPGVERLQGSDPTRCCCKYTTACCRIITRRDSPKGHCNKGLVDNLLLRAHTHVCCRVNQRRVVPRVKEYRGLADQMLLGAYTCVLNIVYLATSYQSENLS